MIEIAPVEKAKLYSTFMAAFADYPMDVNTTTEEHLLLRMQKNTVDYHVSPGLYDGDRLVGFTLIGIDRWGDHLTAYDAGTGIVPDYRKQGWVRKMFDHALPWLREKGVERFVLEVLQQNEPAIKAYERSGFELARELKCYIGQVGHLQSLHVPAFLDLCPIDRATLVRLESSADWLPSFENRFSAIDAIPDHVQITGAFEGDTCIGAAAYSPPLNWFLTLLVDPEYRRRGGGTALIRYVSATLSEQATQLAVLNVDGADTGMQAFFESLGFTPFVNQYEMVRGID